MNHKKSLLLWLGDGFSAFGSWIDFLAILTLASYAYQVSPYGMAAVSAAGLLPGMLAAGAVGRACDRGDPKRLLLVSLALRVAATLGLWASHDFALFVAIVALRSVLATVAPPAINVMALRAVPTEGRQRFYAVLNLLNSAAKVLAPALGTLSSAWRGESFALGLSALCSAVALAVFAFVALDSPQDDAPAASAAPPAVPAPAAGMLPLLWIAATQAFLTFSVNNLVPLVLQREGFDKSLLGVLVSCSGAGNVLSAAWLARGGQSLSGRARELVVPALLQSAGFAGVGLAIGTGASWLLPLLFFAIGTVSARFAIACNVYLVTQHGTAVGEVSGRLQAWQNAMILAAPMVGAAVLERWGGPALFGFATASAWASFALFGLLQGMGRYPTASSTRRISRP